MGIYAIFAITNHLFRITGGADAVSAGDRRLVPAIATACGFHGTVYGMGAMCIAMLANYIPATVRKRSPLKAAYPWGLSCSSGFAPACPLWVYHVAVYPAVPAEKLGVADLRGTTENRVFATVRMDTKEGEFP